MPDTAAGAERPQLLHVHDDATLIPTLRCVGLSGGRPVIVLVGGAGGMGEDEVTALAEVLREAVLPVLGDGGVLVDGGTNAGVMRAAGRARADARVRCLLVGVAAEGTIAAPAGSSTADDAPAVEPGHTHVLLVPGRTWGDESPWIGRVASLIADGHPSVTMLANGGVIAGEDVAGSLAWGRPVIVLARTGRLADEIASTRVLGSPPRPETGAARIARSDLTTVVDMHDLEAIRSAVTAALSPARGDV